MNEIKKEEKKNQFLEKFVSILEKERLNQKDYIYNKLYRFFGIDLTIFPIIIAIFSLTFDSLNEISIFSLILFLLAVFCFFIAVIYKFSIIPFKLYSFMTPINALDKLKQEEWDEEFIQYRWNRIKEIDKTYFEKDKMIRDINQSICFTMSSIVILLTSFLHIYLIKTPLLSESLSFIIIITIDIFFLLLAICYKWIKAKTLKKILKFGKKKIKISRILTIFAAIISFLIIIIPPSIQSKIVGFIAFFLLILIVIYESKEEKKEKEGKHQKLVNIHIRKFHSLTELLFIKGSLFDSRSINSAIEYIKTYSQDFEEYFGFYLSEVLIKSEKTGNMIKYIKIEILNKAYTILFRPDFLIYRSLSFNNKLIELAPKSELQDFDDLLKIIELMYLDIKKYIIDNFEVELKII